MAFPRYSLSPAGSVERTAPRLKSLLRGRSGGRRGRGRSGSGGRRTGLQPGDQIGGLQADVLDHLLRRSERRGRGRADGDAKDVGAAGANLRRLRGRRNLIALAGLEQALVDRFGAARLVDAEPDVL